VLVGSTYHVLWLQFIANPIQNNWKILNSRHGMCGYVTSVSKLPLRGLAADAINNANVHREFTPVENRPRLSFANPQTFSQPFDDDYRISYDYCQGLFEVNGFPGLPQMRSELQDRFLPLTHYNGNTNVRIH
jgi:hypothetical protein